MLQKGWGKKLKNWENQKKKITEKTEPWKKPIKILKKLAGSIRFYKPKTKKTKTETGKNKNQAKAAKNQAKSVWNGFCLKKPNRIEISQFEPVSVFLKKKLIWLFFLYKN
jgi:hypothetical protein